MVVVFPGERSRDDHRAIQEREYRSGGAHGNSGAPRLGESPAAQPADADQRNINVIFDAMVAQRQHRRDGDEIPRQKKSAVRSPERNFQPRNASRPADTSAMPAGINQPGTAKGVQRNSGPTDQVSRHRAFATCRS